jgi:hypothetical protein
VFSMWTMYRHSTRSTCCRHFFIRFYVDLWIAEKVYFDLYVVDFEDFDSLIICNSKSASRANL